MIDYSSRRGTVQSARSQLAMELLLTGFAVVAAVIVLRTLLVVLQVSERIWIGQFVFGLTRPVTDVLDLVPGSQRIVYGRLNVVDITLLALLVLFLLGLVATGGRRDSR
ncbi:MAG: hypothetical protein AVDCRST_MAG43-175 [uncultured Thermomicrobiales bacterium]|uniref:YggT family protein n=1 Tax=uncultured Thermomicrobiales bacterium TaxID=1645740 RepID=A0A6J4U5Z6_9BACT|nr:MAG: hypothetical protein AVDCRST_MAG43-175 [uncultured Thermomicrobiales bacterium]